MQVHCPHCGKPVFPDRMTEEQILAGRTPAGGWTKKQLVAWGVPWPCPSGWKRKLMNGEYAREGRK